MDGIPNNEVIQDVALQVLGMLHGEQRIASRRVRRMVAHRHHYQQQQRQQQSGAAAAMSAADAVPSTAAVGGIPYMVLDTATFPNLSAISPFDGDTQAEEEEAAGGDGPSRGQRQRRQVILPLNAGIASVYLRNHLQGMLYLPGAEGALLGRTRSPSPPILESERSRLSAEAAARELEKKLGNEKERRVDEENDKEDKNSLLSSEETTEAEDNATDTALGKLPQPGAVGREAKPAGGGRGRGGGGDADHASANSSSAASTASTRTTTMSAHETRDDGNGNDGVPQQRATDFTRTDFFAAAAATTTTTPAASGPAGTTSASAPPSPSDAPVGREASPGGPRPRSSSDAGDAGLISGAVTAHQHHHHSMESTSSASVSSFMAAAAASATALTCRRAERGGIRYQWGEHVDTKASQLFRAYWVTNKDHYLGTLTDMDGGSDTTSEEAGEKNEGNSEEFFHGLSTMSAEAIDKMADAIHAAAGSVNVTTIHRLDDNHLLQHGIAPRHIKEVIASTRSKRIVRDQRRLPLGNEECMPQSLQVSTSDDIAALCSDDVNAEEEQEAIHGQTLLYRSDYLPVAGATASAAASSPPTQRGGAHTSEEDVDDGSQFRCYASNSLDNMPTFALLPIDPTALVELCDYMVSRAVLGPDCEPDLGVCDFLLGSPEDSGNGSEDDADKVRKYEAGTRIMAGASFLQL